MMNRSCQQRNFLSEPLANSLANLLIRYFKANVYTCRVHAIRSKAGFYLGPNLRSEVDFYIQTFKFGPSFFGRILL